MRPFAVRTLTFRATYAYFMAFLCLVLSSCFKSPNQSSADPFGQASKIEVGFETILLAEGESKSFELKLDRPAKEDVSLRWVITGADASTRFQYADGTASLSKGAKSLAVYFTVNEDIIYNPDIQYKIELQELKDHKQYFNLKEQVFSVVDNDPKPELSFDATSVSVNEDAGLVNVNFSLDRVAGKDIVLSYDILGTSTAIESQDFTRSDSVTIPAGLSSFQIPINIVDDAELESVESIVLKMSSAKYDDIDLLINAAADSFQININDNESTSISNPTSFILEDRAAETGFPALAGYTSEREVLIKIEGDSDATKWCVSSLQTAKPIDGNASCIGGAGAMNGWYSSDPELLDGFALGADLQLADVDGATTYYLWVANSYDEVNPGPVSFRIRLDRVGPTPTIARASSQSQTASTYPIRFEVDFGEAIQQSSFLDSDVYNDGFAFSPSLNITAPGDPMTDSLYQLSVTNLLSNGSVRLGVDTGSVIDLAGNPSLEWENAGTNYVKANFPEGKKIYRSSGFGNTSALALGTNSGGIDLSIRNSIAKFSQSLPLNVGIGDAIQYDSSNDGSIDSIVFIHKRLSSTEYLVKDQAGVNVSDMSNFDQDWSIYRAYTSLADAESGNINSSISIAFDSWSGGRNLVVNDESWEIILYADAEEVLTSQVNFNGWTTSGFNSITLRTPIGPAEVGTRQRHKGVLDNTYYKISNATGRVIHIGDPYINLIGLQIEGEAFDAWENVVLFQAEGTSQSKIENNIFSLTNGQDALQRALIYGREVSGVQRRLLVFNNVFLGQSTTPSIMLENINSHIFAINNTFVTARQAVDFETGGYNRIKFANNITSGISSRSVYLNGNSVVLPKGGENILSDTNSLYSTDVTSASLNFFNPGGGNYAPALNDTQAFASGLGFSEDFTTDILEDKRLTWDVGAFAVNAVGGLWTGAGGTADWSNTANWYGGSVPSSSNDVVFNYICGPNCNVSIDINAFANQLMMASNYTGSITQASGNVLEVTEGMYVKSGSYSQTDSKLRVRSDFQIHEGSLSQNGQSIEFWGNLKNRIFAPDHSFGPMDVNYSVTGHLDLLSNIHVAGNLTFNKNAFYGAGHRMYLWGDINCSRMGGGEIEMHLVGSNQTLSSVSNCQFPNLFIHSSGTLNVIAGSELGIQRDFSYISGSVNWGSGTKLTLTSNVNNRILSNGIILPDVEALKTSSTGYVEFLDDAIIDGDFLVNNNPSRDIRGGSSTVRVRGDVLLNNYNSIHPQLILEGSNLQYINIANANLNQPVVVNKAAGTKVLQTAALNFPSLDIQSGEWEMNNFDLSLPSLLNLEAGTKLYTGCSVTLTAPTVTGTGSIVGGVAAATLSFSVQDVSVTEGGVAQVLIGADNFTCDGDISLDYTTLDGTALVVDKDYVATSGTATFSSGSLSMLININTIDDDIWEPAASETFSLQISNPSAGTISDSTGVVSIFDNEVFDASNTFVWTGDGATDNWNDADNWAPNLVPSSSDIVYFESSYCTNCNVNINTNINVKGLRIYSGFTATITQLAGVSMDINESGWFQHGGTFIGGTSNISLNDNGSITSHFFKDGGSFTSTSATLQIPNDFYLVGGTNDFSLGTVELTNGQEVADLNITGVNFNDFRVSKNWDGMLANGNISVLGDFYLNFNGTTPASNITFDVHGDYHLGSGGARGGLVRLVGTGNQTVVSDLGSNPGYGIEINKPSGTAFLSGTLNIMSPFRYVTGTLDPQTSKVVASYENFSFEGTGYSLYDLDIKVGQGTDTTITGSFSVLNDLNLAPDTGRRYLVGGSIDLHGDLNITDSAGGNTQIRMVGSGVQNITGVNGEYAPYIEIASSGTVNFPNGTFGVDRGIKYTSGTVNVNNSLLNVGGAHGASTIDLGAIELYDLALTEPCGSCDISVVGTLTVNNQFTLSNTDSYASFLSGTIAAKGNVNLLDGGESSAGLGTLRIEGNSGNTITGGTGVIPNLEIASTGGTVTFVNGIKLNSLNYISGTVDASQSFFNFLYVQAGHSSINSGTMEFGDVYFANTNSDAGDAHSITGTMIIKGDAYFYNNNSYSEISGGPIELYGDLYQGSGGTNSPGNASIIFKGTNYQKVVPSSGTWPSGKWTVDKTGGVVYIEGDLSLNRPGQDFEILNGVFRMNGNDMTVNDRLDITGGSFHQDCGVLSPVSPTTGSVSSNGTTGTPQLSVSDISVIEGESGQIAVEMDFPHCSVATEFTYSFDNLTAIGNGVDFSVSNYLDNLSFGAGNRVIEVFSFDTTQENVFEPNEIFELNLSSVSGGSFLKATGQVTILNDDAGVPMWTGLAADDNWSSTGNWSTNSVPSNSEIAYFDSSCTNCNVNIDVNIDVEGLHVLSGYSGTITQSSGVTVTIGSSGLSMASGNFLGSDSLIDINGPMYLSGTSNFQSTTADLQLGLVSSNSFTLWYVENVSNFSHNNGKLTLFADSPWACGTLNVDIVIPSVLEINDLDLNGKSTGCGGGQINLNVTGSSTLRVLGTTNYWRGRYGGVWEFHGDINVMEGEGALYSSGGTGTFRLAGSSNQTVNSANSGTFPDIEIASTGGVVSFTGRMYMLHDIRYVSGAVDMTSMTWQFEDGNMNKVVDFGPSAVVQKVIVDVEGGNSLTFNNSFTVGDLELGGSGTGTGTANGAVINVSGDVTINSNFAGGSIALNFIGSGVQNISNSGGVLPSGTITSNTTGSILLGSNLNFSDGQDLILNSGSLDMNGFDIIGIDEIQMNGGSVIRTSENLSYSSCSGTPCPP